MRPRRRDLPEPVPRERDLLRRRLARTLPPVGFVFAVYMTWVGADVPGGACGQLGFHLSDQVAEPQTEFGLTVSFKLLEFLNVNVAKLAPHGVICLISALAFHGLTTEIPHEIWLAVERKARKPKVAYPPVRAISCAVSPPPAAFVSEAARLPGRPIATKSRRHSD